jgi:ubiquinone/menaquinone biosynthesis C-methylase UbiE
MLDMTTNKNQVYKTYNKIAQWFDEHRSRELFERSWLDKAIALLPKNAEVLDLGCGMGEPIIPYFLSKGMNVTGVDGSEELLKVARDRFPQVELILGDMRNLKLNRKFDLVIAWHSFFHLPQEDQRAMFNVFVDHLNPSGVLLFTSGEEAGEVWSENGGEELYHASLSISEYKDILKEKGFNLIDHKGTDPECGEATVWLARLEK